MADRGLQNQTSITSRLSEAAGSITWNKVKESMKLGTLRVLGLEPTSEEKIHWEALQGTILTRNQANTAAAAAGPVYSSLTPRDAAAVRHITGRSIHRVTPGDGSPSVTIPAPTGQRGSVYNKGTGRNIAIKTQLKPDLWKVAYQRVRQLSHQENVPPTGGDRAPPPQSFFLGEKEGEDDSGDAVDGTPVRPLDSIRELNEDFFGIDDDDDDAYENKIPFEDTDSVPFRDHPGGVEAMEGPPKPVSVTHQHRNRIRKRLQGLTLSGGYRRGYGGLGLPTLLLRFQYKGLTEEDKKRLDSQILHKRPFFTYWLMTVQLVIMITALAVYGFAPYAWDLIDVRDTVLQPDGNYDVLMKHVVGNVWGGPRQQDLVVLGALYAPCMRSDRRLFLEIESDRERENSSSGCCVRRDRGGCFQTVTEDCSERFNDWHFVSDDNLTRAVCGTSPRTCTSPDPNNFPGSYIPGDVLTWLPICRNATESSENHLTCEVTARPCCYGVQAICTITTREVCDFLEGRFHQDTFLCSQVDCLNEVCGLLPFREFNQPDQIYRLWLALFLHAGIIHLIFSLFFDFFVLRHVEKRLGWWRTALIYILSGVGGNMVSAFFVPYYPETGPAGSILGIVAYFFVFLIFESPHLEKPWIEALKLFFLVLLPLLVVGLLPFVDNFAHIGGFVFGFLLSGIFVPYWAEKKAWENVSDSKKDSRKDYDTLFKVKIALIVVGIVLVVGLFLLFILLFYFYQFTHVALAYLNCVPITENFCIDNLPETRDRNAFII